MRFHNCYVESGTGRVPRPLESINLRLYRWVIPTAQPTLG